MLFHDIKTLIKKLIISRGYELRKAHPAAYLGVKEFSVFELAIKELYSRKGQGMTFVEIGANDGVDNDPIRPYIDKYGLRGILVEPQPLVFERLKKNYLGVDSVKFENCAISSSSGSLKLYYAEVDEHDQNFAFTLASSNRKAIESYAKKCRGSVVELVVPCVTPETLLKKHGFSKVDILQIDTEGMDFEILKSFNLKDVSPSIIHYESGQLTPSEQEKSYRYLNQQGYEVLTQGGDTIALPASL